MSVYVDDMEAPFGRMKMCHVVADTTEELLAMVDKIGVQRKWIQRAGTKDEHFDICLQKRALAVKHGAIQLTMRELAFKRDPDLKARVERYAAEYPASSPTTGKSE